MTMGANIFAVWFLFFGIWNACFFLSLYEPQRKISFRQKHHIIDWWLRRSRTQSGILESVDCQIGLQWLSKLFPVGVGAGLPLGSGCRGVRGQRRPISSWETFGLEQFPDNQSRPAQTRSSEQVHRGLLPLLDTSIESGHSRTGTLFRSIVLWISLRNGWRCRFSTWIVLRMSRFIIFIIRYGLLVPQGIFFLNFPEDWDTENESV